MAKPKLPTSPMGKGKKGKGMGLIIVIGGGGLPKPPKSGRKPKAPKAG